MVSEHLSTACTFHYCNETVCALWTSYVGCSFSLHKNSCDGLGETSTTQNILIVKAVTAENFFCGLACCAWGTQLFILHFNCRISETSVTLYQQICVAPSLSIVILQLFFNLLLTQIQK